MTVDHRAGFLVAAGGATGAGLRWAVVELVDVGGGFPWATLLVNVLGCAGLGVLLRAAPDTRLLLGAGVCGGLTTFSTFSVETALLLDENRAATAVTYVVASVLLGVLAHVVARRVVRAAP